MNQPNSKKNLIIGITVALLAVAAVLYTLISDNAVPEGDTLLSRTVVAQSGPGFDQEVVELLRRVRDIKLDSSIFSNPLFTSTLVDYTVSIAPQTRGRANPFAPVGAGSASVTSSTVQTSTSTSSSRTTPATTTPTGLTPAVQQAPAAPRAPSAQ